MVLLQDQIVEDSRKKDSNNNNKSSSAGPISSCSLGLLAAMQAVERAARKLKAQ